MKTLVIILIGTIIIAFSPMNSLAQSDFQSGMGLAVKGSTNGFGGDVIYNFHEKMSLRLGGEAYSYDRDISFEEEDIEYEGVGDINVGSISLLCDYYISPWFYLSGGASYNFFHGEVVGEAVSSMPFGDIEIPKEMIGDFKFDFDPSWVVSPYLGIGFGRTIGYDRNFGFAVDMGFYYQGPPEITIHSTGLLSPTSNPDHGQEERLEKQINQYYLYPLLRISFSYRIVKFK